MTDKADERRIDKLADAARALREGRETCLAEVPYWAYQTARHYAEQYDPRYGDGLIPASAPLLEDIVQFWKEYVSWERTDVRRGSM